jgi:hypothetical protein
MTALAWDRVGERFYETGIDRGVLFLPDNTGDYNEGHAWNGLTTVTEKPSGADANAQYADNIKYLNLLAAEVFGATVEAFTYPDAFAQCDGTAEPEPGVYLGQQGRRVFGLAYRSQVGNDLEGTEHGYKLHLVYGALAAPSEKAYATINDSPSAIAFSWDVSTTPVPVTGHKPTALLTIDSTKVDADNLAALEAILYGTDTDDPRLPQPDEVITILGTGETNVDLRPGCEPADVRRGHRRHHAPGRRWRSVACQRGQPCRGGAARYRGWRGGRGRGRGHGRQQPAGQRQLDVRASVVRKATCGRDSQVRVAGNS